MSTIETIDLEHLLEHQTWARRLARTLVGESGADDLVQDTWLTAMRRPPRANTEGQLRAWLGTVLRNGARQGFRSEERRRHREERASRDEAMPSAAELTERTEAQRLLLDALLELAPERRQLVLLHFVDGLAAAEIAEVTGLSAGAVAARVHRAKSLLARMFHEASDDA